MTSEELKTIRRAILLKQVHLNGILRRNIDLSPADYSSVVLVAKKDMIKKRVRRLISINKSAN